MTEQLINKINELEHKNKILLSRLHLSKRDNRVNRDKLRKQLKQVQDIYFTDQQICDLDYHLAKIILPAIKRFKEINANGHPAMISTEGWKEILDKIIWSFNELINGKHNYPIKYCKENYNTKEEPWTGTEDESIDKYYKKYQEGFELFGKYYRDLWD